MRVNCLLAAKNFGVHEDNIGSYIKDVAVQIKPPDTLIAEYMEAYEACKPEDFIKEMQEILDTFK